MGVALEGLGLGLEGLEKLCLEGDGGLGLEGLGLEGVELEGVEEVGVGGC